MIISFSGTSASGKSIIIAEIKKSNIFKGREIIIREEDSFLVIKILKVLLGEGIFSKYKEEKFFKKRYNNFVTRFFSALSYLFYPIVVYLEFLTEYIWYEVFFPKKVLIGDRFTYDYEVTFREVLKISNSFVEWLYRHSPKPYLAFLIDIDLKTALIRNKNNIPGKITAEKSFHRNVLARYRQIAEIQGLIIADNNGKLKNTVEQIKRDIINKEKFKTVKRIIICGLDGSGKTTTANMLSEYINNLGIKAAVAHFYHENLIFKFLKRAGFYKNIAKNEAYKRSRERAAKERQKQTPFVLALFRFADSYIQYLFFILIHREVLIFDRFFYDYLVSFEYLKIRKRSIFKRFLPDVKNKILLNSLPGTAYKRKPESVKEFFRESSKIYLKMAKEQNMKIIHTDNKNPRQVLEQVISIIN